ncbi:MAG TPA: PEP-CTERM sorting domain-containing protein [Phycisphaerae bacterium]|nr:PEP-CTERM sorting domain-containing protein [Phycisphaerae bacterium]
MKRALLLGVVAVLLGGSVASGAPTINLKVITDKATYDPGDPVNWTIYAWTAPAGNAGVALLGVTLTEDQGEVLQPADVTDYDLVIVVVSELTGSTYGLTNKYILRSPGTSDPSGGLLADILVDQDEAKRKLDVGNGGGEYLFAQGSFTATVQNCLHTLSLSFTGANYWPNGTDTAVGFDTGTFTSASYQVTPEPASLCLLALGAAALFGRRRRI